MNESERMSKLMDERRWCYFIPPQDASEHGYIPALVIEGESGYHMMTGNGSHAAPWYWGKTEQAANETCDAVNERKGISKADQTEIVQSSMIAKAIDRHDYERADDLSEQAVKS
jgi:hypothetical protein